MKIFELKDINLSEYFSILKESGEFCATGQTVYLSTLLSLEEVSDKFKCAAIREIGMADCSRITNDMCRRFCSDLLTQQAIKEFEESNQEQLKQINQKIDFLLDLKEKGKLGEYMNDLIKQEKVGDNIGTRETSEESCTESTN